jgi:hypothetical protein
MNDAGNERGFCKSSALFSIGAHLRLSAAHTFEGFSGSLLGVDSKLETILNRPREG